jgi:hypothetical protein
MIFQFYKFISIPIPILFHSLNFSSSFYSSYFMGFIFSSSSSSSYQLIFVFSCYSILFSICPFEYEYDETSQYTQWPMQMQLQSVSVITNVVLVHCNAINYKSIVYINFLFIFKNALSSGKFFCSLFRCPALRKPVSENILSTYA